MTTNKKAEGSLAESLPPSVVDLITLSTLLIYETTRPALNSTEAAEFNATRPATETPEDGEASK